MTDVAHSAPAQPGPNESAAHAPPGAPAPPRANDATTFASGFQELPTLPAGDLGPAGDRAYSAPRRVLRRPWVVQLIAFAILLAIWQYLAVAGDRVPSIDEVVSFMVTEITGGSHGGVLVGEFWSPLGLSLQRYAIGLAIGIPAGAVLGLLLGASNWVRGLLNDTTLVLLALPAVVWAFLASLWFGLSSTAPIVAVVLTAIPFVAINLSSGVRSIDPALMEMSKSYKVPRRNQIVDLLLGGTLPNAFTGVRLAITTGWNSLLIVEWFSATAGVGWRARFWYDALRYPGFVGWIFLFVLLITVLDRLVLRRVERQAFQWSQKPTLTFAEDWGM
ncbi:MAG: ABC transporter permease subunit [Acidimicrobiaceae bacterium]|nr:ABC transporter permease subunit [Acidimicrobiaceae bacterium]